MVKKQKARKEKQLNLGLKESPKNFFFKIKSIFSNLLIRFEIKEIFRSPLIWAVLIISLCLTATQAYILTKNYNIYPDLIPIWKNQTLLADRLAEKEYLYIFPSLSVLILTAGMIFSNIFFYKEKFLSKLLSICILLSIIGLTISFLKLTPS